MVNEDFTIFKYTKCFTLFYIDLIFSMLLFVVKNVSGKKRMVSRDTYYIHIIYGIINALFIYSLIYKGHMKVNFVFLNEIKQIFFNTSINATPRYKFCRIYYINSTNKKMHE